MEQQEWLTINFTLPKEPSRARVSIWRKLKQAGSVNIGQSLWILPLSDKHNTFFEEVANEVEKNSGEAYIMKTQFTRGKNMKMIIEHFNAARDDEYKELLDRCEEFPREIDKETARKNFSYAEIEENEHELEKLNVWFKKITSRDFFGAPLKEQTQVALLKCKEVLEDFSNKVYEYNDAI